MMRPSEVKPKSKFVQIATCASEELGALVFALDDKGWVWVLEYEPMAGGAQAWHLLPALRE